MKPSEQFSRQEKKVIELLLKGRSNKQMAALLNVTPRTIEFHLSNIYRKLKVTSRTEAVLHLSEEHPRESTGFEEIPVPQRKSTVDKKVEQAKNGVHTDQLRRQRMPYAFYVLIAVVLVMLILIIGEFIPGMSNHPSSAVQGTATTGFAAPSNTPSSSPIATLSSTATPTIALPPTVTLTADPTGTNLGTSDEACSGPMPARLAGPKTNMQFVNATKGNIILSLNLAKNKFGDCGYRSYTLAKNQSISLTGVMPYGCYFTYALINDPSSRTHVASGPDCVIAPDNLIFTVTYTRIKVSLAP